MRSEGYKGHLLRETGVGIHDKELEYDRSGHIELARQDSDLPVRRVGETVAERDVLRDGLCQGYFRIPQLQWTQAE